MKSCCLLINNKVDASSWDMQVADLGGGFFHCHASAVYMANRNNAAPVFIELQNIKKKSVAFAVGSLISSKFWPFSSYCKIATFPATPVASGKQEFEKLILEEMEHHLSKMGVFKIGFASYHSPNSEFLLTTLKYNLTQRSEFEFNLCEKVDDLFKAFSATKRNQYRKAEKNGVSTTEVNSIESIETVEKLHNLSMNRRGIVTSDISQKGLIEYQKLLITGRIRILISYLNQEPVSAYLFGVFNNLIYGLRSGSSEIGNKSNAPIHLIWTAINLFKKEGYHTLSLGGAKHTEPGLRKFKRLLGANEINQPSGSKTLSNIGLWLDTIRSKLR